MKNRDYFIFILGCLFIGSGYVFGYQDEGMGSFLSGFGTAAILIFIIIGIALLIRKKRNETT